MDEKEKYKYIKYKSKHSKPKRSSIVLNGGDFYTIPGLVSWNTMKNATNQSLEIFGEVHGNTGIECKKKIIEFKTFLNDINNNNKYDHIFVEIDSNMRLMSFSELTVKVGVSYGIGSDYYDFIHNNIQKGVKMHFIDYRAEIPSFIGMDVQFLDNLLQNDPNRDKILQRELSYLIMRFILNFEQYVTNPAKEITSLPFLSKEIEEGTPKFHRLVLKFITSYIDLGKVIIGITKSTKKINTQDYIFWARDMQADIMNLYTANKISNIKNMNKGLLIVGASHVNSISSMLQYMGWSNFSVGQSIECHNGPGLQVELS